MRCQDCGGPLGFDPESTKTLLCCNCRAERATATRQANYAQASQNLLNQSIRQLQSTGSTCMGTPPVYEYPKILEGVFKGDYSPPKCTCGGTFCKLPHSKKCDLYVPLKGDY